MGGDSVIYSLSWLVVIEKQVILETLTSMKRAGADLILTSDPQRLTPQSCFATLDGRFASQSPEGRRWHECAVMRRSPTGARQRRLVRRMYALVVTYFAKQIVAYQFLTPELQRFFLRSSEITFVSSKYWVTEKFL